MKRYFIIIAILLFGEVLNKSLNVYYIDLQEEKYISATKDSTLPANSEYFFIIENSGESKIIQIRTRINSETDFEVGIKGFDEALSEDQISSLSYGNLPLVSFETSNYNNLFVYSSDPLQNKYISIKVIHKKEIDYFTFYVKNHIDDEDDEPIVYEVQYLSRFDIDFNELKNQKYPHFLLTSQNPHSGKSSIHFYVKHDTEVKFELIIYEAKNYEDFEEM